MTMPHLQGWVKAALVTLLALLLFSSCSTRFIWDINDPGCGPEPVKKVNNDWTAFCAAYAVLGEDLRRKSKPPMNASRWIRSVDRLDDGKWAVSVFNAQIIILNHTAVFSEDGNPVPIETGYRSK